MLIALKALLILLANMGIGCFWAWIVMAFLFLPKKQKRLFGKPVPFTPGLLRRKKIWLVNRAYRYLDDYLNAAMNDADTQSVVARWEQKARAWMEQKLDGLQTTRRLPAAVGRAVGKVLADVVEEIARQLLRDFVPYLVEHYRVRHYIDLADKLVDVEVIYRFANRYVFKYIYFFMLGLCGLIGLFNVIVFLLLQLF